jgi:pyruvate,water dikinase
MAPSSPKIRWFESIRLDDIGLVGGKNASLGELYCELGEAGVRVPNGFALTVAAYVDALSSAQAWAKLHETLDNLDIADVGLLAERGAKARQIVYDAARKDANLRAEIEDAYRRLETQYGAGVAVAVRSSATAEDLPTASFAGQHDSYLNIRGVDDLFEACCLCFASAFTDRAIVYRINNEFDHFKLGLSVGVMKMARSDRASSGVIFTLDTESGFRDVVFITGIYGLGENIVQGKVDPDEFHVHKPTFKQGYRTVLRRSLGQKRQRLIFAEGHTGATTRNVETAEAERASFCIEDAEALKLADHAIRIEEHYSRRAGRDEPMDIEWAKDADDGELYIVQARPETVASRRSGNVFETYRLAGAGAVLLSGKAVGEKIGSGLVRIVNGAEDLKSFQPGEVLVASSTSPDWEPVMKTAGAIITDHGGRTCHAAIVARELGIPAVVGVGTATRALHNGDRVTVSCAGGETGAVYAGEIAFEVTRLPVSALVLPKTEIMLNLGNPGLAFRNAMTPNAGVGLARMEFIISEHIRVHPMALMHPEKVAAPDMEKIRALIHGFASPGEFFVRTLSEGVGTIAAAFYPKPVIIRLSDFKTNEYAQLLGGAAFEPHESNPMLGFRGASRYDHPAYADGFALECAALRRVREEMGLTNLRIMVPFCRRVVEAERVLKAMARHGLERGRGGLEIYVMCEIPNNVIQVDAFAAVFDGFSIGSNDLTQLTLGVDRDSETVAFDFDERDPGMLEMLRLAVAGAKRNGRHIGICGEAPANYPEIAKFLTGLGIDSISVNPSSLMRTIAAVREAEQTGGRAELHAGQSKGGPPISGLDQRAVD